MSKRIFSKQVVDGPDRAPSRAMLRAVGFDTDDFDKLNCWTNMEHRRCAICTLMIWQHMLKKE